ncbi:UDP-4-amino-4,6-dideoxy-N-acetyl-beta-L-altrosamine N-acetyltransferase [Bacteroides heparinolyticus]|uniref:UDP-4-amino-4, 6-dideoxy-N-acetyl-beta-L-altrosamine N-acetyltransferase n=1 Tax=Prevotella heparinolytica TaxID=28113 RepID=A0A2R3MUV2_9BACE|nr:UDP-4-amino-4,6-dideoxy-N-acetyl-beta-L-altrosamine N-acetyltransferase [Bacteroides heparinolyticus]AVM58652.1 UDP-4-amino-4,6-dideoxy-N-acetyl-beta-L-altrosamine N-acetyltransferase [Bacteroides heparinolyticus]TCO88934.1 UDP-4-amino-4,6-dideoxy-N-acetyl-beta-L-altrosamine N-acetyltransferase [Bacteroides heparinolyticus]
MIDINKKQEYKSSKYIFKSFLELSDQEKKMILEWRNSESIKKWMYNKNEIQLKEHLEFIDNLKERNDRYYWLVMSFKGNYIGVVNINDIDKASDTAELGLYMNPKSGELGYNYVRECFYFFFNILDFGHLYCAVAENNRNALLIDAFLGCEFSSQKKVDGDNYLVSTNLDRNLFMEKYDLKIRDYIKFCKAGLK